MSKKRDWMPFKEARAFVRKLNLKNSSDWIGYADSGNLPDNIPVTPKSVYKDKGWKGLGDWLGTGVIQTQEREYLSFSEARSFARTLHFKSTIEWKKYCQSGKKPGNIPATPYHIYKEEGWISMYDWLGHDATPKSKIDYLPFEEARKFVHTLRLKKTIAWKEWCKSGKKPENIHSYPNDYYKNKGWINWRDWLGPL
jgi:hypothetical protein